MKTLTNLIQGYLGMTPKDVGCNNWAEMQAKMEREIKALSENNTIHQAMLLWPEYSTPSFKMNKSGEWEVIYEKTSSYGLTMEAALYHCASLCKTSDAQTWADKAQAQKWDAIIELLSEYVVDPIGEIEKEVEEIENQ